MNDISSVIIYLINLTKKNPSSDLKKYFESLQEPKELTLENFIEGVQQFTEIANLNPERREKFFGSSFQGLHYKNDLTHLWNEQSSEKIKAWQVSRICPDGWDNVYQHDVNFLIYKGNKPSAALKKLLQGPSVIDCGMFCQLSIWFGMLSVLGDELFDQLFGKQPFFVTQFNFGAIETPSKAYLGNPLYPFFSSDSGSDFPLRIEYICNHPLYKIKHPGGSYSGENSVVIKDSYTIFGPILFNKSNLSKKDIEKLLLNTFNSERNQRDLDKLELLKKQPDDIIDTHLGLSYKQLIQISDELKDCTLSQEEWFVDVDKEEKNKIGFDFEKFVFWVRKMQEKKVEATEYIPLEKEKLNVPDELMKCIPYENRDKMSFNSFKRETPLQQKLYQTSLTFCSDIINNKSAMLVLTGKAGIGKTASAVSCLKELVRHCAKITFHNYTILGLII